jgi:cation diffusion facilitator CzcD-associated flavoprotein CzcO
VTPIVEVAIVGAGPYGLSIAAHLSKLAVPHRIFGSAMQIWKNHMPGGMLLKSEGFASNLYDPDRTFTLAQYCRETGRPYADVGLPVPLETFSAYGSEFQKRLVPHLEETKITSLGRGASGFELSTESGEKLSARRVVVATGITHFGYLPPPLSALPSALASHSSQHGDLSGFRGRKVAVVGAGASAVDIAAILHDVGAEVDLVARSQSIAFHEPSTEPRPLWQQFLNPRSTIGLGWRSRLCTDAPLVFHAMPARFRFRVLKSHLGPAPGWFMKDKVVGRVSMHLGATLHRAAVRNNQVVLGLQTHGGEKEIVVDHVIGGTGYRVSLQRLDFLDAALRRQLRVIQDAPVLNRAFESSVAGLHFVGLSSASCFGPLARFACGAEFTAKRLSGHLGASVGSAPRS